MIWYSYRKDNVEPGDAQWEYLRWNQAVTDTVFAEKSDPVPVYLDLEDDVLAAVGAAAGHNGAARDGLCEAVRRMTVRGHTFTIDALWELQVAWRSAGDFSAPPPTLAFLALTVLAAEDMGKSDDGFDATNYYSRLCALLAVSTDSADVRRHYMRRSEALWSDLNRWLEQLEGQRGLPTAYALSFRYVGLPMSQALVREQDRRKLPGFFAQFGLAAGMELAPEVLERYLDAWFGSDSCPASASLKRLWAKHSACERIAAVAAVELAGWDGTIDAGQAAETPLLRRVGLVVQIRQGFLGSSLDLALGVRHLSNDSFEGIVEVEAADGEWLPLILAPAVADLWRTSYTAGLDVASVLEGVVKIRLQSDKVLRHYPRSIVPLVFDELQSAFLEQERLQLNVDCMLLVRSEAKGRKIASQVTDVLATCARPGFTGSADLPGLPPGWCLISNVQLFAAPESTVFNELVPLARDQLTIAGGVRIPSRIRKWSSRAAPEIRASVESASSLRLTMTSIDDEEPRLTWTSQGGALVVALNEAKLPDGDYRVALYSGTKTSPLQRATVRLRSSAGVDSGWHFAPRLAYALSEPGDARGAITAREVDDSNPAAKFVDGAVVDGQSKINLVVHAGGSPIWSQSQPKQAVTPSVRIGSPDPESCVVTGAHYLEYPPFLGDWQQRPKYIDGACRYCGLVKRSPGWSPRKGAWPRQQKAASHINIAALPAVDTAPDTFWDAALDALMHLGGGDAAALTAVSSQIDGSALFASAFSLRLESLGHIAVERRADGTPTRWEVSPSCLVESEEGLRLVGFWPDQLIDETLRALAPLGGRRVRQRPRDQPTECRFEGVDAATAEAAVGNNVSIATDVTSAMLAVLPPLSDLAAQLSREPMAGFDRAERYDVRSSSWLPTNDTSSSGSYRLTRGFERLHLFRSPKDIEEGQAARASAYLVKHLAANAQRTTLAVYVARSASVVVPRGCDLPGLYARALVLTRGHLPRDGKITISSDSRRCLIYPGITQEQADALATLLSR